MRFSRKPHTLAAFRRSGDETFLGHGVGSLLALDGERYRYDMLINVSEDTLLESVNVCVVVTGNSAEVAITWPEHPAFAQLVTVVDGDGHALTYPITVHGNGHLINGEETLVVQVNSMAVTMVYNGTKLVVI
jgi:hypothetical protein